MSELKPCPFCWAEANFERLGDRRLSTIVTCDNCGCFHECGEEWDHGRAWNTRPTEDRLVGALEEAERALEEIADGTVGLDKAGHYLAHRKAVNAARSALTRIRAAKGGE